jgi:RHS repeat-associated protein
VDGITHKELAVRLPHFTRPRGLVIGAVASVAMAGMNVAAAAPVHAQTNAVSVTSSAAPSSSPPNGSNKFVPTSGSPLPVNADGELPTLRTATSRTFETQDGYQAQVFAGPVNYQDSTGTWQKIDDSLVSDGAGGYTVKANSYSLHLPGSLDSPLSLGKGAAQLSVQLHGAAGTLSVSGATATYKNAFPGVDASYSAEPSQVKETLTLASASTPTSYTYALTLPKGITPKLDSAGDVQIDDSAGKVLATLPKAFMVDAAGVQSNNVTYGLSGSGTSWTLTVTPDSAWLNDPTRTFPVVLDPTATFGDSSSASGCYLSAATPANSKCSGTTLQVGGTGSSRLRTLLQFDVNSVIPADAEIHGSELDLDKVGGNTTSVRNLEVHQVTNTWTSAATWNKRNSSTAWSTAGGDYSSTVAGPAATTAVNPANGVYTWALSKLVSDWVTGDAPNDGILIRTTNENTSGFVSFGSFNATNSSTWPVLKVFYANRYGQADWMTYWTQKLSDRMQLQVNVSSGNLEVLNKDAIIAGPNGNSYELARTYNSRRSFTSDDLGRGWLMSSGQDVSLRRYADAILYTAATGVQTVFYANPSGGYDPSPGVDATLSTTDSLTYTLSFWNNGTTQTFKFDNTTTDNQGGLISQSDRNGNASTFAYSATSNSPANGQPFLNSATDAAGRTVSFTHPGNYIASATDSAGRTYTYKYTGVDLTEYNDPNGGVTKYAYDGSDRMTQITTPASDANSSGNVVAISYDGTSSRVRSVMFVTNPTAPSSSWVGPTYTFYYTTNLQHTSSSSDQATSTLTDPNSHTTTYTYDDTDRVVKTTDPLGHVSADTYTGNNDLTKSTDAGAGTPGPNATTNTFDTAANHYHLKQTQLPSGSTTTINYPSGSDLASSTTDPQGDTTTIAYDAAGNLTQASDTASGLAVHMAYQGDPGVSCGGKPGALCSRTSAGGNATTYHYDSSGNLDIVTPPSPLGATHYSYDGLGRVLTKTDGKGQITTYSYDALDRPSQILQNGAATCVMSSGNCLQLTFDADGELQSVADGQGGTLYHYDALGRQISKQPPGTSTPLAYGYDAADNLVSYSDSGGTVTYGYNAANQLINLSEPGGSCTTTPTTLCTTFDVNNDGYRTATHYPNGVTMSQTPDASGRTVEVRATSGPTTLTDYQYSYLLAGQDTSQVQSMIDTSGHQTNYGYNSFGQLTSAIESAAGTTTAAWLYCYDSDGNRTGVSTSTTPGASCATSPSTSYGFNAADELTSQNGNATGWGYDANGNETSGIGATVRSAETYSSSDQLTGLTSNGVATSFGYLGVGNGERTSTTDGSGTTAYQSGQLGLANQTNSAASTYFTRDPDGQLVSLRQASGSTTSHYYYLFDGTNSVVGLTDSTGVLADSYTYDPYGNLRTISETVSNPYRYTSGYFDQQTQMYKFGARYYDPSLGRFTQPDPSGQEANAYAYAADNPVNDSDPSGLIFGSLTGPIKAVGVAYGEYLAAIATADFWCVTAPETYGTTAVPCFFSLLLVLLALGHLIDTLYRLLQAIWNDIYNPAAKAGNWVYGVGKSIVRGAGGVVTRFEHDIEFWH